MAGARYQSFPRIRSTVVLFRSGYRDWSNSHYQATLAPVSGHTAVVISNEGRSADLQTSGIYKYTSYYSISYLF